MLSSPVRPSSLGSEVSDRAAAVPGAEYRRAPHHQDCRGAADAAVKERPPAPRRRRQAHDASIAPRCHPDLRKGVGLRPEGRGREGVRRPAGPATRSAEATTRPGGHDEGARLGSARLGSARLGSARLGSARLGSARLGSARLGSARLGSARLGSARLGSARLLIILFAASSHSSAFKNIALPLHGCRQGCRRAGREPGKRCPVASTEAAKPLGRDEGAKNARTGNPRSDSGRSRPNGRWLESYGTKPIAQSDGDVARRAALEPRARSARAVRERRGGDPPRPRAALGQGHDFAYPMCPSRHFRFVREYHHIIFMIQYFGITCRDLADVRSDFVYRTDKNGPIASMGPRTDPPEAGENAARGRGERARPGRLTAGKQVLGACGAPEQDRAHDMDVARP